MGNFKRNDKSGKRRSSGGFAGRNSERSRMYKAICSECQKSCEVPFKPTGDKPIFCSNCFRNKGNAEPRKFSGRDSRRFSSDNKIMHKAICDACGKECEVPFRPTGSKPIYCNQCFGKEDKNKGSSQANKQFELINTKLDKILEALNSSIFKKKG